MNSLDRKRFPASWYRKGQGVAYLRGKAGFSFLGGGEVMKQVTFKTLDTAMVHEKLIRVGERIYVVSEFIDRLNDAQNCAVLPILKDAEYELGEVYGDLQLNSHKEGPKKKSTLRILPSSKKRKKEG